jgi:predicted nucleic acid-binding protein
MIVVDSSIWIDHFHVGDERISVLIDAEAALVHPFVYGEILLGSLRDRAGVAEYLGDLPEAQPAEQEEVIYLLGRYRLFSRGIGFVDLHLLASTLLRRGARLWTRDKRLLAVAEELGIAYTPDH